jgi:hypothetical protein
MTDPKGLTGEMPVRRGYTVMHPTGSRRRGLISESDGTHTSKGTYIGDCNHPRCRAIRAGIGAYGGSERCRLHLAPLLEVVA